MVDWPQLINPWDFKVTLKGENGETKEITEGTSVRAKYEFKTWIICKDPPGVIGYIHWGFTVTVDVKKKNGKYEDGTTYTITANPEPKFMPAPEANGWDELTPEQQEEAQAEYDIYKNLLGNSYNQYADVLKCSEE
ncbi:MAG: hypothetical protein HY811_12245 [Planctomycetes bacterium]|nr:hypothetical protein [Planctomycetota bacterium]